MRSGKNNLEDILDSACNKMESIIKNSSKFRSIDVIKPELEKEKQRLLTRDLKRAVDEIAQSAERSMKNAVQDFMTDAEEVLMRFLPEVDSSEVVSKIQSKIINDIENKDLFAYNEEVEEKKKNLAVIENGLTMVLGGAIGIGLKEGLKAGYHALTHEKKVEEMLQNLRTVRNMDVQPFIDSAFASKNAIVKSVKDAFITQLVERIQAKVEEILSDTRNIEERRSEAESKLASLNEALNLINAQIAEMS